MAMKNIATLEDFKNIDGGKLREAIMNQVIKTEKYVVQKAHLMGYTIRLGLLKDIMKEIS